MKHVIAISISTIALLTASTAFATEPVPPPPAPVQQQDAGPCHRGSTQIHMGGMDLDQMKCQMVFAQGALGSAQMEAAGLRAANALLEGDLAAAKAELAKAQADLEDARKKVEQADKAKEPPKLSP
jgi:multidrug resistance efflux pump